MTAQLNPLNFFTSSEVPKDLKGYILSFIPYEYKGLLVSTLKDPKFVEKHIHHYEPHRFIWEEYDRIKKDIIRKYEMVNGKKHGNYDKWSYYPYYPYNIYKEYSMTYVDGVKNGLFISFYEDGTRRLDYIFKNNKMHGVYKSYYDIRRGGGLYQEMEFKNGENHGASRCWSSKKTLMSDMFSQNDKVHGIQRKYNSKGNIRKELLYNKGKLDGIQRIWDKYGNLENEDSYINGILNGCCKEWNEFGKLNSISHYKNGVKDGEFAKWLKSGQLSEICFYTNDVLNGEYYQWKINGKLDISKTFVDGMLHGKRNEYWDNGFLKCLTNFNRGNAHGIYKKWAQNGQLVLEGEYLTEKICGTWKNWNDTGSLLWVAKYDKDGLLDSLIKYSNDEIFIMKNVLYMEDSIEKWMSIKCPLIEIEYTHKRTKSKVMIGDTSSILWEYKFKHEGVNKVCEINGILSSYNGSLYPSFPKDFIIKL